MEIKILTKEEADYRTYAIIHFYHFGVIPSDAGLDFVDERILLKKPIHFLPFETPFQSVRLSGMGHKLCKNWARRSGENLNNLRGWEDIYEADSPDELGKVLMSHRRLTAEFKAGRSKKLLANYAFDSMIK